MNNERKNINEELKGLSQILSEMEQKELFQPPAFYFEGLQKRVLEKTARATEPQNRLSWIDKLLWLLQPQYSLSFAVVLVIIIMASIFNIENHSDETNNYAEINSEAITEYLAEADIQADVLSNELTDEDIEALENQFAMQRTIQPQTLNTFLLENIDEQIIMEELL
jgi:hypothetical protein